MADTALVLSGGLGLGAFGAGAAAALDATPQGTALRHVAGTSAGALSAAILAGNPAGQRGARLRAFWETMASDRAMLGVPAGDGPLRSAYNQVAAWQTLLWGRPGAFRSRLLPATQAGATPAVFDLAPLIETLPRFLDFDRLNAGTPRVSLVATDVVSGERVVFDTSRGDRITPRHVAACGAMLPLFLPIEVEGRLLGDGGLASNAPLDLVLDAPREAPLSCFILEQFGLAGSRPASIGAGLSRAIDLGYGHQTRMLLDRLAREARLRAAAAGLAAALPEEARVALGPLLAEAAPQAEATLALIDYHAGRSEAGALKPLDFSRATLLERWRAGEAAMAAAVARLAEPSAAETLAPGLRLHRVRGGTEATAGEAA